MCLNTFKNCSQIDGLFLVYILREFEITINTGFGYRIFEVQYFKEYLFQLHNFQCLHWMSPRVACIVGIELECTKLNKDTFY